MVDGGAAVGAGANAAANVLLKYTLGDASATMSEIEEQLNLIGERDFFSFQPNPQPGRLEFAAANASNQSSIRIHGLPGPSVKYVISHTPAILEHTIHLKGSLVGSLGDQSIHLSAEGAMYSMSMAGQSNVDDAYTDEVVSSE